MSRDEIAAQAAAWQRSRAGWSALALGDNSERHWAQHMARTHHTLASRFLEMLIDWDRTTAQMVSDALATIVGARDLSDVDLVVRVCRIVGLGRTAAEVAVLVLAWRDR